MKDNCISISNKRDGIVFYSKEYDGLSKIVKNMKFFSKKGSNNEKSSNRKYCEYRI